MRAKILTISADLFVTMCKPSPFAGWTLERNGLPDDARIERIDFVFNRDTLAITLVSDEWPDVAEAEKIPMIKDLPTFKTIPAQDISNPWARSEQ